MKDEFGRDDHEGVMNFARIITLVTKNLAVKFLVVLFYTQEVSRSHLEHRMRCPEVVSASK